MESIIMTHLCNTNFPERSDKIFSEIHFQAINTGVINTKAYYQNSLSICSVGGIFFSKPQLIPQLKFDNYD
jgi:hypothetical protein